MTPKERAKAIVEEIEDIVWDSDYAQQCALIAVKYAIKASQYKSHINGYISDFETTEYWILVKQEIETLWV